MISEHESFNDDDLFVKTFIENVSASSLTYAEIADKLRVSRPTIERWIEGKNLPHDCVRKAIINGISAICKQEKSDTVDIKDVAYILLAMNRPNEPFVSIDSSSGGYPSFWNELRFAKMFSSHEEANMYRQTMRENSWKIRKIVVEETEESD